MVSLASRCKTYVFFWLGAASLLPTKCAGHAHGGQSTDYHTAFHTSICLNWWTHGRLTSTNYSEPLRWFNESHTDVAVAPILTFLKGHTETSASHIFHTWESFWPALALADAHLNITRVIVPRHYAAQEFADLALKEFGRRQPRVSVIIMDSNTTECFTNVVVVENSLVLQGEAGVLARKIYTSACLSHETSRTRFDVLFLTRRMYEGNPRIVGNLIELDHALKLEHIRTKLYTSQSGKFCEAMRVVNSGFKVIFSLPGDHLMSLLALNSSTTVLEIQSKTTMGPTYTTMYCSMAQSGKFSWHIITANPESKYVLRNWCAHNVSNTMDSCQEIKESPCKADANFRGYNGEVLPKWLFWIDQEDVTLITQAIINITTGKALSFDDSIHGSLLHVHPLFHGNTHLRI